MRWLVLAVLVLTVLGCSTVAENGPVDRVDRRATSDRQGTVGCFSEGMRITEVADAEGDTYAVSNVWALCTVSGKATPIKDGIFNYFTLADDTRIQTWPLDQFYWQLVDAQWTIPPPGWEE